MRKLTLKRITSGDNDTFGVLLQDGVPFAVTLELPWKGNQHDISCIPAGLYTCRRIDSPKFGVVFEVAGVPERSSILIHKGNTVKDTHGCILIGMSYQYLNGAPGITQSGIVFENFMRDVAEYSFSLEIKEA